MSFETLPQHNLNLPEFHPISVPAPPVTNTTEMIAPLLNLAHYLSPSERAKRKAAMAKASYEYRLYSGKDPRLIKDPFFMQRLQGYQDNHRKAEAYINHINKLTKGSVATGPQAEANRRRLRDKIGISQQSAPGIDMHSESMPPDLTEGDVNQYAEENTDSNE